MTIAISYESESQIVETDSKSRLALPARYPHRKYVRITETDGSFRFIPLDQLHESERAVLENPSLYAELRRGLQEYAEGKSVSSDWLFDDE